MNELQTKAIFDGYDISDKCDCGSSEFSVREVNKSIIDFSNGYFEELFPYYIIKCRNCQKETRIKT